MKRLPCPGDLLQAENMTINRLPWRHLSRWLLDTQPSDKAGDIHPVPSPTLGPMSIPPRALQGPGVAGHTLE